MKKLTFICQ